MELEVKIINSCFPAVLHLARERWITPEQRLKQRVIAALTTYLLLTYYAELVTSLASLVDIPINLKVLNRKKDN